MLADEIMVNNNTTPMINAIRAPVRGFELG